MSSVASAGPAVKTNRPEIRSEDGRKFIARRTGNSLADQLTDYWTEVRARLTAKAINTTPSTRSTQ